MSKTPSLITRERVRAVCVSIICINAILLGLSFFTHNGRTPFGHSLGGGCTIYYYTGAGLNQGLDIYQPGVIDGLLARAGQAESPLPFLYPPFFAGLFRPLALLPYAPAFAVWILIAVAAYFAGFQLLWPVSRLPAEYKTDALLIILAFVHFQVYTLAGGWQSWFGFFWLALTFNLEYRSRDVLAGLTLSVCLYKPTLLLIILPALVVRGRFKILSGFAVGAVVLVSISLAVVGQNECADYARTMLVATGTKVSISSVFPLWKYVDIVSFCSLLFHRTFGVWLLIPGAVAVLFRRPRLIEAVAWTAPVNLYTPMYDVALIAIPALLAYRGENKREQWLYYGLFCAPWVSELIAHQFNFQLITPLLICFGLYCASEYRTRISCP